MRISFFIITLFFVFRLGIAQERITLEQVIALALEKNYDIQLSRNSSLSANTDHNFAKGAFLPVINSTGSRLWNSNDQRQIRSDNSVIDRKDVESNSLSASAQLTWTLFDGTKMFATRQRISEIAEAGELNLKNQIVNSLANVIINYYNIVRQKQQLVAIQEQMSVSEERVKLAEKKLQVGTGGKPELLQARVDLNAQRTQVLQQQTAIIQLKDQLNSLVGMLLPTGYDVTDSIIIDLNLNQQEIEDNIENTNYGLQSARMSLSIAGLSLRERRAERYPVVNFTSAYNFIRSENSVSVNAGVPLYNRSKGYNYGFTVTLPILNGFNNRRLVRQAEITIDRQKLLYDQQKTVVDVGIRNAFVNYDNAKKILLVEEETILLAKENLTIALESFKQGIVSNIVLRTAQQSLADAYNRLITARYNAKVAETELLRLNGDLLR